MSLIDRIKSLEEKSEDTQYRNEIEALRQRVKELEREVFGNSKEDEEWENEEVEEEEEEDDSDDACVLVASGPEIKGRWYYKEYPKRGKSPGNRWTKDLNLAKVFRTRGDTRTFVREMMTKGECDFIPNSIHIKYVHQEREMQK